MSSVSHLHKLACDLAFRCTIANLLRCFVLSLCVNFGAYRTAYVLSKVFFPCIMHDRLLLIARI